ncbi:cytochrome P450 [Rhodococcus sp. NPDC019627]|uniref:cytochrome P450 n=1 Tax=unclassified Rhodococcus (in: high G+C Gram-positive bacteria) TaxID=192944 RepID=UPI0033D8874F
MNTTFDDVDLVCEEALADPHTYFSRLRDQAPIAFMPNYGSWLVTGHPEVRAVLSDPVFTSDRIRPFIERKLAGPDTDPRVRAAFEMLSNWLVFNDAPIHTRLRKLVFKAFTPKTLQALAEPIDGLCTDLLEKLPAKGHFDVKHDYSDPLAAIVIAQLLGVPPEDRDRFKAWSQDVGTLVSAGLNDPDRHAKAAAGMEQLGAYCFELLERNRGGNADNLMTRLAAAQVDDDTLSDAEVVATCTLVLFAGHETSANLLANGIRALLRHPDQLTKFRDGDDEVRRIAIEELLRFDGPGKAVVRWSAGRVQVGDEIIEPGQRVFSVLASANRDPRVFDDPNTLNIERNHNPHIAFGHGIHHCMGSSLARLEASIALPRLFDAYPHLAVTNTGLTWQPVFLARSLDELPVSAGHALTGAV